MKTREEPYPHDPPRCEECSIANAPVEKSWDDESETWYCEICEPLGEYENQAFIWREEWTRDDIRELVVARFDRVFRERYDEAKKPRTLDTIGEMEMDSIDAFYRAFELRLKRAKALAKLGHGPEIPPES